MNNSQKYIGAPNGIVLCMDQMDAQGAMGRFYHFYSKAATEFQNVDELMFEMETFFDELNFPYPATAGRAFAGRELKGNRRREPGRNQKNGNRGRGQGAAKRRCGGQSQERIKAMKEEELLRKHGDLGTFIVRVQQRQNSSWQGRITWSERNETLNFRSAWEMVRLIADALQDAGEPQEIRWAENEVGYPSKD